MVKHIILIASYLSLAIIPSLTDAQTKSPDFNNNGTVDFADFILFAGAFGSETSADLDIFDLSNNGIVDFEDFLLFAADFGKAIQPPVSEEAQLIALSISGEIQPPQSLSHDIEAHLTQIRAEYGNIDAAINSLSYRPPWVPGRIIIGVDTTTNRMIKEGSYRAWDVLNLKYQISEIKTTSFDTPNSWVVLSFDGILHPRHLANLYANLPGVKYAEPDGYAGDSPNIYPLSTPSGFSYLFRDAWGDCPSGCIYNKYWYFIIMPTGPQLIGSWDPQNQPSQPSWWPDAKENIDQYRSW